MAGRLTARWLERALLVVGIACLAWVAYNTVVAAQFQRDSVRETARVTPLPPSPATSSQSASTPVEAAPTVTESLLAKTSSPPVIGELLGVLEVPRLGLTSPVVTGDDDKTLNRAAGHLPDTPRPWESGNSAIAAHRDGLFRPLKGVRVGDLVTLRTPHGEELRYEVRSTKIVMPTDVSVLEPTTNDVLTLITCYPFNYVGNAPKRFIVRAERVAP
jgi:sortase A